METRKSLHESVDLDESPQNKSGRHENECRQLIRCYKKTSLSFSSNSLLTGAGLLRM
jgi:hypothetical protein